MRQHGCEGKKVLLLLDFSIFLCYYDAARWHKVIRPLHADTQEVFLWLLQHFK